VEGGTQGAGYIEGGVAVAIRARAFVVMGTLAVDAFPVAVANGRGGVFCQCVALEWMGIQVMGTGTEGTDMDIRFDRAACDDMA
jgi:hypothetical protein